LGVDGMALPLGAAIAGELDKAKMRPIIASLPLASADLLHEHAVVLARVVLGEHGWLLVAMAEFDAASAHHRALVGDGIPVDEKHERSGHDGAGANGEPTSAGERLVGGPAHLDSHEHVVRRRGVVVVHAGGHAEPRAVSCPAVDAELRNGGGLVVMRIAAVRVWVGSGRGAQRRSSR
jgi:hypothetical protein